MKSHTKIFLFTILDIFTYFKDPKYVKIYSVNPLYLIFNKVNGYFEENNENKYLTLLPTNKNKEKIKKYEELWSNVRNLILILI